MEDRFDSLVVATMRTNSKKIDDCANKVSSLETKIDSLIKSQEKSEEKIYKLYLMIFIIGSGGGVLGERLASILFK